MEPVPPATDPQPPRVGRIAEIVQTVLTALLLALAFRTFFVEPFIIPTGSMAETLRGAHVRQLCHACGWTFDFGPAEPGPPTGESFVLPAQARCPNCGFESMPTPEASLPQAGDRLLVEKWLFAAGLQTPQRWDVIVFRDANAPQQHLIKRAVGLPGETIELREGDLFINGMIARKPRHVQNVLWSIVYDQNHAPQGGNRSSGPRWGSESGVASGWTGLDERVLRFDPNAGLGTIAFRASSGTDYFRDMLGYNHRSDEHFVGDLRVRFEISAPISSGFACTIERPGPDVTLRHVADSMHVFELCVGGQGDAGQWRSTWSEDPLAVAPASYGIEFGYVDRRAYLAVNGRVVCDSGTALDALESSGSRSEPIGVVLVGDVSACEVRGLRIDRDVYYSRTSHTRRATPGEPFQLERGEYFVLGDNSADSHDSREWRSDSTGSFGRVRAGTVRAEQIVGKATFVYLPAMLPLDGHGTFRMLNIGEARFVR